MAETANFKYEGNIALKQNSMELNPIIAEYRITEMSNLTPNVVRWQYKTPDEQVVSGSCVLFLDMYHGHVYDSTFHRIDQVSNLGKEVAKIIEDKKIGAKQHVPEEVIQTVMERKQQVFEGRPSAGQN